MRSAASERVQNLRPGAAAERAAGLQCPLPCERRRTGRFTLPEGFQDQVLLGQTSAFVPLPFLLVYTFILLWRLGGSDIADPMSEGDWGQRVAD